MQLRTLCSLLAVAASADAQLAYWAKKAGLEYFGTATDNPEILPKDPTAEPYKTYSDILRDNNNFDQLTVGNAQKWAYIEPEPGVFKFDDADVIPNLAQEQGKMLRCHTLVWHSQLAPWVENGNWTKDEMRHIIVRHVTEVMTHFKGRCHHWDVANEVISDDADGAMRPSVFYNVLGEEYLRLAFQTASEVDPDAKLYLNEYAIERPTWAKTHTMVRLVKMLKDHNIRIDGVGIHAHIHADRPMSMAEHRETMDMFAALDVDIAYTELDVRITMPVDSQEKLTNQTGQFVRVSLACAQHPRCVGITLWDFYDPFSWIPSVFPDKGAATIYFDDWTPHPALDGLLRAFRGYSKCKDKRKVAARGLAAKLFEV